MWPFKQKAQQASPNENDYLGLRASVGMGPARDDDVAEFVAWLVVYDVLGPVSLDECQRHPAEQQPVFMLAYATYLSWLAKRCVDAKYPPRSWQAILPLLQREFSKTRWYRPDAMRALSQAMDAHLLSNQTRGLHSGVSGGPWVSAVRATNVAGYALDLPAHPEFPLYVAVMSNNIIERISSAVPTTVRY